jgi:hypothetical protein
MKMMKKTIIAVRALNWNWVWRGKVNDKKRSRMEGFGGGARKAMEKSWAEEGEEGVTMIAGREDFSVTRGSERSRGAGIRV